MEEERPERGREGERCVDNSSLRQKHRLRQQHCTKTTATNGYFVTGTINKKRMYEAF